MAPTDKPCCLGTVKTGELKGKNVTLGPLTTYVTGADQPGAPAVLIVPDIYGFGIPNTRYHIIAQACQAGPEPAGCNVERLPLNDAAGYLLTN